MFRIILSINKLCFQKYWYISLENFCWKCFSHDREFECLRVKSYTNRAKNPALNCCTGHVDHIKLAAKNQVLFFWACWSGRGTSSPDEGISFLTFITKRSHFSKRTEVVWRAWGCFLTELDKAMKSLKFARRLLHLESEKKTDLLYQNRRCRIG